MGFLSGSRKASREEHEARFYDTYQNFEENRILVIQRLSSRARNKKLTILFFFVILNLFAWSFFPQVGSRGVELRPKPYQAVRGSLELHPER